MHQSGDKFFFPSFLLNLLIKLYFLEFQIACARQIRAMQSSHIRVGFADLKYNFLVGGNGAAYEGRGWHKMGNQTIKYNSKSIGIAFIGSFMELKPSKIQLKSAQLLISEGVRLQYLRPDYRLYAHKQLAATDSPGTELTAIIMGWPNWSNEPY